MQSKVFKTSFGHTINIDDNYRKNLPPVPNRAEAINASSVQESGGGKAPPESDYGIVSDFFQFAMMADWLDLTEVGDRKFEKMLDIGGSTGLIGQLFKAVGRTRTVENIEILDFQYPDFDRRVRKFLAKMQEGRKHLYSPSKFDTMYRARWILNEMKFSQSVYPYPISEFSNLWRVGPNDLPPLDKYILDDLMVQKQKYDFMLSATTMHHFSVPVFLKQCYDMLEPGGVLLIWNCYWYWVMIITSVWGDFPWAIQRLTSEDFVRYLQEHHPNEVASAKEAMANFHNGEKRYTLRDYIDAGEQIGFKCLDSHRLTPYAGIHNRQGTWSLEGDHGIAVQKEVLRDIHCFRKDVELVDLQTHSVFVLLQKPSGGVSAG